MVRTTSNLQQLLNQGAQKFVINQANSPNKIIISSSANQVANQDVVTTVSTPQTIVHTSTASQIVQAPQQIVVNQPSQKVIQQQTEYVNPTNQQQQIIFQGQRFVLNPGQRIQVTQQQPTQVVQQIVQQPQVVQQISQVNRISLYIFTKHSMNFSEKNKIFFFFIITKASTNSNCPTNITTSTNHNSTFTANYKPSTIGATIAASNKFTTTNCRW